jgi:1-acyl-sn-glycerol-3-phosphate acyltransferase
MAIKQLEAGRGVVVFPEGTRTPDGQIQEFMAGIALLIRKAKVPVLPVAIGGAYDAWAIHARRPRFAPIWMSPRKHSLAVVVGPLIPAETLLGMEPKRMVEYLREVIWHLRKEAYRRKRLPSEAK